MSEHEEERRARAVAIVKAIAEHAARVRSVYVQHGVPPCPGTQPVLRDLSRAGTRYVTPKAQAATDEYIRVAGEALRMLDSAALRAASEIGGEP